MTKYQSNMSKILEGKFVSSNIKLNDKTFNDLRELIYNLTGIYYTDTKKYLLESKIGKRVIELKLQDFAEYISFVKSPRGKLELEQLYIAITINETYFFRADNQFQTLENFIIPEIIEKKSAFDKTVRFWSAASSSGEEAYTIALLILEKFRLKYPQYKFEIYASDINSDVVKMAKDGIYAEYAIRNIPPTLLNKYFIKKENRYHIDKKLKDLVNFSVVNLYDTYSVKRLPQFDVVFCANVLIYFDIESKKKVVKHIYDKINNNGYLFIGYTEILTGISDDFKLVRFPNATAYLKE